VREVERAIALIAGGKFEIICAGKRLLENGRIIVDLCVFKLS